MKMAFEVTHSEIVFKGRVFDVKQESVRLPGGRQVQLDIVEHGDSVTMLPLDEEGQFWFVRQYRHPAKKEILEFPAGVVDEGEEAQAAALREIREETGMAAGNLKLLGSFYLAPGYSTEYMYVYLATGLTPDPLEQDEDEVISIVKIPLKEAFQMAAQGKFHDAKTLASLFLARRYLDSWEGLA
jgi:ADP-ribose pyrophosphatase